jgi:hypothetical protein
VVDAYQETKSQPASSGDEYWAAKMGSDLVTAVKAKERGYFEAVDRRGFKRMWALAYAQYFGQDPSSMSSWDTQQISFGGEDGEQVRFRINEARSIARQRIGMVTAEQVAFKCMALNTDYQSLASIETADTVVSYIHKRAFARGKRVDIVEADEVLGYAFGWIRWDADSGDHIKTMEPALQEDGSPQVGPDGQPAMLPVVKRSGAPVGEVVYPWECFHEPTGKSHLWRGVRERRSRWEVMAQYREHAEKIKGVQVLDEFCVEAFFGFDRPSITSDDVIVKHFYHKRCRSMPKGRYVGICGDVILWDLPCPTMDEMPLVEMCSARFIATSFGYSDWWDVLAPQQMIDQICSDMATNIEIHGRPPLYYDKGTDFDVNALASGQSVFTKLQGQDPPAYVQPPAMPPIVEFGLPYLHKRMESIAQLNSVVRGDPEGNITSGEMAALFHSMAIEAQSPKQRALADFDEATANLVLDLVQANADVPFLVEVAGKDERPYLQEFTKQSLAGVRRVTVELSNPLLRTPAGRLQVWAQIKDLPDDQRGKAIEIMTSGQWKPANRLDRTSDLRIRHENEQLSEGQPVMVMAGDNPFKHIPEHWAEYEARVGQLQSKPEVLQAIMGHILEHLTEYPNVSPFLAAFLGFPDAMTLVAQVMSGAGPTAGMAAGKEPSNRDPSGNPITAEGGAGGGAQPRPSTEQEPEPKGRDRSGTPLPNPSKPPPEAGMAA